MDRPDRTIATLAALLAAGFAASSLHAGEVVQTFPVPFTTDDGLTWTSTGSVDVPRFEDSPDVVLDTATLSFSFTTDELVFLVTNTTAAQTLCGVNHMESVTLVGPRGDLSPGGGGGGGGFPVGPGQTVPYAVTFTSTSSQGLVPLSAYTGDDTFEIAWDASAIFTSNDPGSCEIAPSTGSLGGTLTVTYTFTPVPCPTVCNPDDVGSECFDPGAPDCDRNGLPDVCDFSYRYEDGAHDGFAIFPEDDTIWLVAFTVEPGRETIDAVGVSWGDIEAGTPSTVLVYEDPDDDGDPDDAILRRAVAVRSTPTIADQLTAVPIQPLDVGAPGEVFFVGAMITFPGPEGLPWNGSAPPETSWFVNAPEGTIDVEDLANNPTGPASVADFDEKLGWLIRARPVTACACPADLTGSGSVGFTDLAQLLGRWGACDECPEDLDGDGTVGFTDLAALLGAWGPC